MNSITEKFDELYPESTLRYITLDGDVGDVRALLLSVFTNGADCAFDNALQLAKQPTIEQMEKTTLTNILAWVDSRIEAEVTSIPRINMYYDTLNDTWGQVRKFIVARQKECNS